jgi:hypothetical protein
MKEKKLFSKKRIAVAAIAVAAFTLLSAVVIIVAIKTTQKPAKEHVSVKTMESLALKYLNERNRMLVSSEPDVISALNVPIIKKSEMSPQIAAQQRIDIEKIRKHTMNVEDMAGQYWDRVRWVRFDTEVKISDIKVEPEKTTAHIYEDTRLYFIPDNGSSYSEFVVDRHFTFVRNEAQWMISDVKVDGEFSDPPLNEPSEKPANMADKKLFSKNRIAIAAVAFTALALLSAVVIIVAIKTTQSLRRNTSQ